MGESQITGKISKLFLGAIAACFAGSIVAYFFLDGSSGACF